MVGLNWWMKPIIRTTPTKEEQCASPVERSRSERVKAFLVNLIIRHEPAKLVTANSSNEKAADESNNKDISESSSL